MSPKSNPKLLRNIAHAQTPAKTACTAHMASGYFMLLILTLRVTLTLQSSKNCARLTASSPDLKKYLGYLGGGVGN